MALPETPQTREEAYLNAVATGSTSGLPSAPQTREEQYLDYIAKNGGGSGGGGVLAVGLDMTTYALDKTWQEIYDAMAAGQIALVSLAMSAGGTSTAAGYVCVQTFGSNGGYQIAALGVNNGEAALAVFTVDSADGYPVLQREDPSN